MWNIILVPFYIFMHIVLYDIDFAACIDTYIKFMKQRTRSFLPRKKMLLERNADTGHGFTFFHKLVGDLAKKKKKEFIQYLWEAFKKFSLTSVHSCHTQVSYVGFV